jgi:hypothetical protein
MSINSPAPRSRRSLLLSSNTQLIAGFAIPTFVLLYFSDESRLGPLWAMMLALAFPLALELYSLRIRRKPSVMSLLAIVGILFVGAISLLGLSEGWLALRRSLIYIVGALVVLILLRFKREIINKAIAQVVDMDVVYNAAKKKGTPHTWITRHINRVIYLLSAFLLLVGIATYIVTIVFITAPAGTSEFNAQYAQLRVMSIIFTTIPLLAGVVGLLMYMVYGLEKMTGVKAEDLWKKKQ